MNWILIMYMSTGFGSAVTGGPTSIDGFRTEAICRVAGDTAMLKIKKMDWYQCIQMDKQ